MTRYHATSEGRVPFTKEEEEKWDAMEAEWLVGADDRAGVNVREIRNILLSESDWTQVSDVPMASWDKEKWLEYRQALRDITDHENFPYLNEDDWPTKP